MEAAAAGEDKVWRILAKLTFINSLGREPTYTSKRRRTKVRFNTSYESRGNWMFKIYILYERKLMQN